MSWLSKAVKGVTHAVSNPFATAAAIVSNPLKTVTNPLAVPGSGGGGNAGTIAAIMAAQAAQAPAPVKPVDNGSTTAAALNSILNGSGGGGGGGSGVSPVVTTPAPAQDNKILLYGLVASIAGFFLLLILKRK